MILLGLTVAGAVTKEVKSVVHLLSIIPETHPAFIFHVEESHCIDKYSLAQMWKYYTNTIAPISCLWQSIKTTFIVTGFSLSESPVTPLGTDHSQMVKTN